MAVTDPYVTVEEYRAETQGVDTANDAIILRHLTSVSRFFERETGQFFTKDAAPVARLFRGCGSSALKLTVDGAPGIVSATGLVIEIDEDDDGIFTDETDIDIATVRLAPYNAALGPEPEPYRYIELTNASRLTTFPAGKLVQVTATYGWPNVPAAVKSDVIKLTGIWRTEMPEATGQMNELEQVVNLNTGALSLIKRFKLSYKRMLVG